MASRNVWIAVAVIIIVIVVGSVGYYWYILQTGSGPTKTPTSITLYEGDTGGIHGVFGLTSNSLTSPGPTLNFTLNEYVKVTVYNVGTIPHNWAIVSNKSDVTTVLFSAQIQSASNPISPGSSGSATFTVNQAGNFYYVCQVPGHVDLGMYGNVVVTGTSGY